VAPRDVGDMHDTSLDGGCGSASTFKTKCSGPSMVLTCCSFLFQGGVLDEFLRRLNRLTQSSGCKARLSKVQLVSKTGSAPWSESRQALRAIYQRALTHLCGLKIEHL
jgi:hypothetical protein